MKTDITIRRVIDYYELPSGICDFIEFWDARKLEIPPEYRHTADVYITSEIEYGSSVISIELVYDRPETDEEEQEREKREEAKRQEIAQRELQTLAHLKQKYGE